MLLTLLMMIFLDKMKILNMMMTVMAIIVTVLILEEGKEAGGLK